MLVEDTSENGRSATELQRNGTDQCWMLTAGRPNAASSHVSHSDSIQHPLTNRWATAIGHMTLTCNEPLSAWNLPSTQVQMDYTPSRRSPSPRYIGLAAPCNLWPDVALSHTLLGITETMPSL
ncbi:hypothetical protein Tsp_10001 [Trichinella spiralis]|uniref:hypothetical protein n=1 Tax=Trichinella spiralis TaxID=6334 RepID=UPI0001EFE3BE|nr:hypothetical protein Tsp_10001 [Trichinella spiralis]